MFRRILVPVDFTERTKPALDYALELAASHQGSVDVLHVWEPPKHVSPHVRIQIPGETRETLRTYIQTQAIAQLSELIEGLDPPDGVDVRPIIEEGRAATTILEVAERDGHDLIIVATAGRGALARLFIGSVAENLVRNAPCPVLTIRVPDAAEDAGDAE